MSHQDSLPKGVTPKHLPDGKENQKYADLLEEDKPIAGQKFVCLSFVSPEHIIKQKEQGRVSAPFFVCFMKRIIILVHFSSKHSHLSGRS